jgi:hypothetical protein
MPEGLIEGLLTFLGILFFFVLPMIARARSAARRSGQLGGLRLEPGPPRAPERVEEEAEEQPEEEPATAAAPAPTPAASPPRVAPPMEPSRAVPARVLSAAASPASGPRVARAPGASPDRLRRLRRLSPWQQAVALAEILGPPRGLQ